jgi:uncharacterized membrane protein
MSACGILDNEKDNQMIWLVSGIVLWAVMHFIPAGLPDFRKWIMSQVGETTYRGVFALLVVIALVMIIAGWRSTVPVVIYAPPAWGPNATFLLMFVAIVLFGAAHAKTNIKRVIRHPQLNGLLLWSLGHIVSNGDIRSLLLFGGLGLWASIEIALLDHRDGEWIKPERASLRSEAIGATVGVVVFLVLIALHPYFAGVSPLPI